MAHLLDEPTDNELKNASDGDVNDSDKDSDDDIEHVAESIPDVARSKALDNLDYPSGFGPCITLRQPDVTTSLEGHEDPYVSQVKDTPVQNSITATVNIELSASLSEKQKQQEIHKAKAASISRAPRTCKNQASGPK